MLKRLTAHGSRLTAIALAITLIQVSRAAHYVVSYTGGTATVTGTDPLCSSGAVPYAEFFGIYLGGGTAGACVDPPPNQPRTGTVNCTGPVTAHFHWTPDNALDLEPPPPVVLIKETSSAHWRADTGGCDNGLNDPALPTTGYEQLSFGSEWTSKTNPGIDFDGLTRSPSANCSHTVGGPSGLLSGSASVTYYAETFPIRLAFDGTTPIAGQPSLIVGQRLIATVTGIPSEVTQTPGDVYVWTRPPGGPFLDYEPTPHLATWTDWSDPGTPSMTCWFAQPAVAFQIMCHVTLPKFGLVFDVQKTLTTLAPLVTYVNSALNPSGVGRFKLLPTGTPTSFALSFLVGPGGLNVGMSYYAKVVDPAGFGQQLGTWSYVQLIGPKIHLKEVGPPIVEWFNTHWTWEAQNGGGKGLDYSYPVPGALWNPASTVPQPMADTPAITGLSPFSYILLDHKFAVYIMYRAPGQFIKDVPLRMITWQCRGKAELQSGIWVVLDAPSYNPPFGPALNFPPHPIWTWLAKPDDPANDDPLVQGSPPP